MTWNAGLDILKFWRVAMLRSVRSDSPDLTTRQTALMLTVYLTEGPHTVRGLAKELNVAKPVITRALDNLGQKGLLKRKRDEKDKRNVLVQRTTGGAVYLRDFSDLVEDAGA